MGCDIHVFTEALETINGTAKWFNCDHWKLNKYFGAESEREYDVVAITRERDYELFGALANVRNGDDNAFISEPKGMPEDASPQTVAAAEGWDGDGHSHSYCTLTELKAFQALSGKVKRSGMLDPETAAEFDATGKLPQTWCGWTNQTDYVRREWFVNRSPVDSLIESLEERMRETFWLFDKESRPEFESKIRIVFWFDN